MQSFGQCLARAPSGAELIKLFSILGGAGRQGRPVRREQVRRLKALLAESRDSRVRVAPQVATELQRIERQSRFTSSARAEFQTLLGRLGIDSTFPIEMPVDA